MPRNVRNFWMTMEVDGRNNPVACGPMGPDGGFSTEITIRRDGQVMPGVRLLGVARPDGSLEIRVMGFDRNGNVLGRFTVESTR